MQPGSDAIDAVSALPFFNSSEILDNLKAELPQYLALATDINPQVDPVDWWQRKSANLPHWSNAASQVLLVQPSSTAAEWVFSLLNNCFTDQQETSLHDDKNRLLCYSIIISVCSCCFHNRYCTFVLC